MGIEACWGAADLGEELVEQLGWNVSLGHPAYIAKIKRSPDKSDYSDGRLLGDLTRVGYLPLVWLAPAYIGDFGRFKTAKQLARYCGLSPCNASSGKRQADAGLINGCNKLLRQIVVQAAHRLIRTDKRWSALADSMRARGKKPCVIVGAVANRWLRNLHHAMKEQGGDAVNLNGNNTANEENQ